MNIAFFEANEPIRNSHHYPDHAVQFFDNPIQDYSHEELGHFDIISVFINSEVTRERIDAMPNLKCIATRSTGYNHIDTDCAKERNIVVSTVPSYGENTVAEHTFALILNLSRNVHKSYLLFREHHLSHAGIQGFDLKGKTLGVFGTGKIGIHVIKIARGFGMKVKAYDVHRDYLISDLLNFEYASIDEVLESSDIITLHMPLLEATKHFINHERIGKMKRGVVLVNTSRGELIDTGALYEAVKNGHVGGLGLDVIEGEQMIVHEEELANDENYKENLEKFKMEKELLDHESVIFTPHNAFNSVEAVQRIQKTTADNINGFINGKPINTV